MTLTGPYSSTALRHYIFEDQALKLYFSAQTPQLGNSQWIILGTAKDIYTYINRMTILANTHTAYPFYIKTIQAARENLEQVDC